MRHGYYLKPNFFMLNILNIKRPPTIIHALLRALNVKFTNLHLSEHINQHPNSGNMLGVSDILYGYNIDNISLKIKEEDFDKLNPPFLVQLKQQKNEFALITNSYDGTIFYTSEAGIKNKIAKEEFYKQWTGVVLLPDATDKSVENDFVLNRRRQWIAKLRFPFVVGICVTIICWLVYNNSGNISIRPFAFYLLLLLYSTGIAICILLLIQSIDKNNPLINKICNLAKTGGNCNDVLGSPAAKLWGIVSWGEIGMVYFAGSLLCLATEPASTSLLFWINILALPYTFWSIYYQWKVAKQWCVLCLSIQILLWLGFAVYFLDRAPLNVMGLTLRVLITTVLCFMFPAAVLLFTIPFIKKSALLPSAIQQLNRIKTNEAIFEAGLKSQRHIAIRGLNKAVVFGNPEAAFIITMVTNPYCGPCAAMHERLRKLLAQYRDYMQFQTIYAVSRNENDERNVAIKQLIGTYLAYGSDEAEVIYTHWYNGRDRDFEAFARLWIVDIENDQVQRIFQAHKQWCNEVRIEATPSIYINGYPLPDWYEVEDLKFFIRQ